MSGSAYFVIARLRLTLATNIPNSEMTPHDSVRIIDVNLVPFDSTLVTELQNDSNSVMHETLVASM